MKYFVSYVVDDDDQTAFHNEVVDLHPFLWQKRRRQSYDCGLWTTLLFWQPLTLTDEVALAELAKKQ